ncbi:zinc-dependent metalloprotease family protein [Coraliomargarita parva]|uniref:zinc-dependent metalloprotease family protein n=1 Tax=Coraliomargarita parva TaxID=3014050 RepID=UPI0022B4E182|nr:M12 family metallo-peptidase [Coraliomargarita parva]
MPAPLAVEEPDHLPLTAKTERAQQAAAGLAARPEHREAGRAGHESVVSLIGDLGADVVWNEVSPAARWAKEVTIPSAMLDADRTTLEPGDIVELALFDGQALQAVVTDSRMWGRAGRTFAATARSTEDPEDFIVIASVDGVFRLSASVGHGRHLYEIRYVPESGSHVLLEVDRLNSFFPGCGAEADAVDGAAMAADASGDEVGTDTVAAPDGDELDANVVFDLMMVYTPAALATKGTLANMEATLSVAVTLVNIVHENSETGVEYNLVHTAEIAFVETDDPKEDLKALTNADGVMDEVHSWRNEYEADFVSLLIDTNEIGGTAWRPDTFGRPDLAFSLLRVQQCDSASTNTTAHELAHNLGVGHSRTQTQQSYDGQGVMPFAAGWQWADAGSPYSVGYCSVMTYENFDSDGTREYDRLPYFSDPYREYNGVAMGEANQGNAVRTIREGRYYNAAFRGSYQLPRYESFPYSYSFGSSVNAWFHPRGYVHSWNTYQAGATVSNGTGPTEAYGDVYYGYVEATSHYSTEAAIEAEFDFTHMDSPSIEFAYHMYDQYDSTMGILQLEISTDQGQSWSTLVLIVGDQGDAWQQADYSLDAYAGQVVRLRFRANVGNGYRSDIAIDAIRIEDEAASDVPANFLQWLFENYPEIEDASAGGDPDGDGFCNFLEYAVGGSPVLRAAACPVQFTQSESAQSVKFCFNRGQSSVRYYIEATDDIRDWTGAGIIWDSDAPDPEPALVPIGSVQTIEIPVSAGARYFRLQVSE